METHHDSTSLATLGKHMLQSPPLTVPKSKMRRRLAEANSSSKTLPRNRGLAMDFDDSESSSHSSEQQPEPAAQYKPQSRACRAFALDFSDSGAGSGSQSSDQHPATNFAADKCTTTNAGSESSGSSSPGHDLGIFNLSFQAVASSSDTRVLIPLVLSTTPRKQPRSLTSTPRKQPRSSTSTPKKQPRSSTSTPSKALISGPSLFDPVCFGFFAPHKAPKTQPRFPKCLAVVLRDPSELHCHPGQARWRKKKTIK